MSESSITHEGYWNLTTKKTQIKIIVNLIQSEVYICFILDWKDDAKVPVGGARAVFIA